MSFIRILALCDERDVALLRFGQSGQRLYLEILRQLPLPVPPRDRQERFSRCVQQYYDTRRRQILVRERIDALFMNMLRRGFRGALTASWREARMMDLLREIEQQRCCLASAEVCS